MAPPETGLEALPQVGHWDEVEVIPDDVADLPHFEMPLVKTPSLPPPSPASPMITAVVTDVIDEETNLMSNVEDMAHLILLDAPLACDRDEDEEFLLDPEHKPTADEKRVMKVLRYMRFLICVAATGGFTSGYSSGVLSGALLPLTRDFQLTPEQEELIVCGLISAGFLSSLAGGTINNKIGRRKTLIIAGACFTFGGLTLFSAQDYPLLVIGEIFVGLAMGMESLTSPMYVSEVAKPSLRGMLVSSYALMVVCGQFCAGIVDGIFSNFLGGWRLMLGFTALPGFLMVLGYRRLPESPCWLVSAEQVEQAKAVLDSIRSTDDEVLDEMQAIITSARKNYRSEAKADSTLDQIKYMLRIPSTRRALILGCGMMMLQQGIGINTVMYYSATIYQMSGYSESHSIWLAAFTSLAQIMGVILSVLFVDKLGRRVLVLGSLLWISISMLGLGSSFYLARIGSAPVNPDSPLLDPDCASQPALVWDGMTRYCYDCINIMGCGYCGGACIQGDIFGPTDTCPTHDYVKAACTNPYGWMPVVFMILFLIAYGVGMAGLPWTINSELYPPSCKSRAISLSTGTMWFSNLIVSTSFLTISSPSILTSYGAFWMYALTALAGACWLYFALPETKGLSFKEIEQQFQRPGDKIDGEEAISLHVPPYQKYGSTLT